MRTVKLLAIVVATVAVTFLCIRSGQALAKTPFVYRATDGGRPEADRGKLLSEPVVTTVATASVVATETLAVTTEPSQDDPTALRQRKEPSTDNRTVPVEHGQASSRSLSSDTVLDDRRSGTGPSISRSRTSPIVVRGKLIKLDSGNHKLGSGTSIVRGDDDADIVVDAEVYRTNNRPYYRQSDHSDYSTVDADISVAEEDGSTGYRNSYDLTYNVAGGYRPAGPEDGTGWNAYSSAGKPSAGHVPPAPVGQPPYGLPAVPYPTGQTAYGKQNGNGMPPRPHVYNYLPPYVAHYPQSNIVNYPPLQQAEQWYAPNSGTGSLHQQLQAAYHSIDWHKVGILALVKIGLAKLKAFGFLKILFLLVFKLKLFLIAVFFKTLLLLKLMKFFKLLMIPMLLLMLMPMLSTLSSPTLVGGLLSIPARIIEFLTGPVYAPAAATASTKILTPSAEPAALQQSGVSAAKIGGAGGQPSSKPDDKRRLDTTEFFDPTLKAIHKVLDSEKCVERVACRMAVVEKAGILPVWINWVLHRVSKFIPNEKLETYLKTYDDASNAIFVKPEAPDNWSTWCLERYDCNSINATNVTKTTNQ